MKTTITITLLLATLMVACAPSNMSDQQPASAVVTTNKGTFTITFYDEAPNTAGNFMDLAEQGFYDGITFHRIINGFMIQGGDPNGDGTGGPGYTIDDEFHPDLSNTRGTLSMANRGPNTGGSQFFINLVDNTNLDYNKPPQSSQHPVFGYVSEGMDVVDAIANVQTGPQDRPVEPVVIEQITVHR